MATSSLSLRVDTGRRKGETLDCNPGDLIRIGRVIRGNTFSIKDPSISQQHLTIHFIHESSLWFVTDLGSSNGTFINSTLIPQNSPTPLADGDLIRIGETTRISVHISASPPIQRSARKRRRSGEKKVPVMGQKRGRTTRASSRALNAMCLGMNLEEEKVDVERSCPESGEGARKVGNVCVEEEDSGGLRKKDEGDGRIDEEMDSMTMADWFDRMEEFLPKEINRVAEEIIESIRAKAARFDEYIDQLADSKCK